MRLRGAPELQSRPSIRCFPTKADLFVGVMSAHTEQLYSQDRYYIESDKAPRLALTEIGCKMLKHVQRTGVSGALSHSGCRSSNFPDLARLLWRECMERGHDLLAEYLQSRRIGGPGYKKSAAQFVSFVLGDFVLNAMLNPDLQVSERMRFMLASRKQSKTSFAFTRRRRSRK